MITNKLYKFIKLQPLKFVVDVLASTAVFVGTTVHQMSPWTTMCCHRYEEVGRTLQSQRHLADSRSGEGGIGCRNVNIRLDKGRNVMNLFNFLATLGVSPFVSYEQAH